MKRRGFRKKVKSDTYPSKETKKLFKNGVTSARLLRMMCSSHMNDRARPSTPMGSFRYVTITLRFTSIESSSFSHLCGVCVVWWEGRGWCTEAVAKNGIPALQVGNLLPVLVNLLLGGTKEALLPRVVALLQLIAVGHEQLYLVCVVVMCWWLQSQVDLKYKALS